MVSASWDSSIIIQKIQGNKDIPTEINGNFHNEDEPINGKNKYIETENEGAGKSVVIREVQNAHFG